jgi:hypothetical protein
VIFPGMPIFIFETQEQAVALGPVPASLDKPKKCSKIKINSPDSTSWRVYLFIKILVSLLNL